MPYWWIAHLPGRPDRMKLGGPCGSEYEAEESRGDLENFRVFNFTTSDKHVAAQNIKAIRLRETGNSDTALKRVSHNQPQNQPQKSYDLETESEDNLFDNSI